MIDLFGVVALVAEGGPTVRARIAPLERLRQESDIVLWAENGRACLLQRSGVLSPPLRKFRFFRLDAGGATELSAE